MACISKLESSGQLRSYGGPLQEEARLDHLERTPSQEGAWGDQVATRDSRPAEGGDKGSSSAASRGGKGTRFLEIEEPSKRTAQVPTGGNDLQVPETGGGALRLSPSGEAGRRGGPLCVGP